MMSSTNNKSIMEKTNPPPPPPPLKCPRCDSSNTKFCYYNNYSLSQPRHFCKSCKRYWTRGGTLRNVPVGGGCRKNKRLKRRPPASASASKPLHQPPQILNPSPPPASNHLNDNHLFYGLPTNPLDPNFLFSGRVSSGPDLVTQMNGGLELGFSSQMMTSSGAGRNMNPVLFGSSSSTMAALLASSFQHQKFLKDIQTTSDNGFSGLISSYDQDEMNGRNEAMVKDDQGVVVVKSENNNYGWNGLQNQFHDIEQININSASDSSSILWNTSNNIGAWLDPSNMGSSVPSLI